MYEDNPTVPVEKDYNVLVFTLMGIIQGGLGALMLCILVVNLFKHHLNTTNILICTIAAIVTLPLGAYYLTYAFSSKTIFTIDETGITKKRKTIRWADIQEIQTDSYRGPRMTIYRISIINSSTRKKTIWFSSDIKIDWSDILDCLTYYTVKNGITVV